MPALWGYLHLCVISERGQIFLLPSIGLDAALVSDVIRQRELANHWYWRFADTGDSVLYEFGAHWDQLALRMAICSRSAVGDTVGSLVASDRGHSTWPERDRRSRRSHRSSLSQFESSAFRTDLDRSTCKHCFGQDYQVGQTYRYAP